MEAANLPTIVKFGNAETTDNNFCVVSPEGWGIAPCLPLNTPLHARTWRYCLLPVVTSVRRGSDYNVY